MSDTKKQDVRISGETVNFTGDIVGRDKVTITYGTDAGQMAELIKHFEQIYHKIDAQPVRPDVDKSEIKDTVKKIEDEVKKGEEANPNKVERWLKFLAEMSDDIFQVTAMTLANPVVGVAKAVQLIAKKAKETETH